MENATFAALFSFLFQLVDFMVKATTFYILNGGEAAAAEWADVEAQAEELLGRDLNDSGEVGDNMRDEILKYARDKQPESTEYIKQVDEDTIYNVTDMGNGQRVHRPRRGGQ